jgi:hypothetical protein
MDVATGSWNGKPVSLAARSHSPDPTGSPGDFTSLPEVTTNKQLSDRLHATEKRSMTDHHVTISNSRIYKQVRDKTVNLTSLKKRLKRTF